MECTPTKVVTVALYFLTVTLVVFVSSLFLRKMLGTRTTLGIVAPSLVLGYLFPPALVHFGPAKLLALYAAALPIAGGILFFFVRKPAVEQPEEVDKITGECKPRVEVTQVEPAVPGTSVPSGGATPEAPEEGKAPAPGPGEPLSETMGDTEAQTTAGPETTPEATDDLATQATGFAEPEDLSEGPTDEDAPVPQAKATCVAGFAGHESAPASTAQAAGELVRQAIGRARQDDFVAAVRLFNAALASSPDTNLQCLIIAELSTIYQQLGRYAMAADLIETFLDNHRSIPPALASALREKMAFNRYLKNALEKAGTPGLRYPAVPDLIKKRAYLEATMNKF